ncbi:hypothetical protein [Pantoea sp.]|uniref:hypothetical protein n=1 Tax=Pantoea sp. TaxID=69393 RepID=UPI0028B06498|nr:hypothetical protein [Pantoea sp.]
MNKLTDKKCREQFEDWLTSLPGFELADIEKRDDGKYSYSETEWCWKSWQASRAALEIALPVLEQQEKLADGWIEWHGGECPVDGCVKVEYRLRDGETSNEPASCLAWEHEGECYDIIAYRVIENDGRQG